MAKFEMPIIEGNRGMGCRTVRVGIRGEERCAELRLACGVRGTNRKLGENMWMKWEKVRFLGCGECVGFLGSGGFVFGFTAGTSGRSMCSGGGCTEGICREI